VKGDFIMKQYISNLKEENYGCIGDYAQYSDYHVGDLVYYESQCIKGYNFIVKCHIEMHIVYSVGVAEV
jgi:hypothetical protein